MSINQVPWHGVGGAVRKCRIVALVFLVSVCAHGSGAEPIGIDELRSYVERAHGAIQARKLLILQTSFKDFRVDSRPNGVKKGESGELQLAETSDNVRSVLELGGLNRFSVEYDPAKAIWIGGRAPFFVEYRKLIYNGDVLLNVISNGMTLSKGVPDKTYSAQLASYDRSAPPYSALHTGQGFLAGYSLFDKLGPISNLLSKYPNLRFSPKSDGESYQECEFSGSNTAEGNLYVVTGILRFDPSKNFGLCLLRVREEFQKDSSPQVQTQQYEVMEFLSSNGVYFPAKAVYSVEKNTVCYRKFTFECKSVEAKTVVDENMFRFDLPADTLVKDKRLGIEYRTGDAPSVLVDKMKSYLKENEVKQP